MLLWIGCALVATIVGIARGGSLDNLSATRFSHTWLLWLGLAVQLGLDIWTPTWLTSLDALVIVVASDLLLIAWLLINRHLPGIALVAAGFLVNLVVITLNQAMPVSEWAWHTAGLDGPVQADIKHEPMTPHTLLPWLADVLPLPPTEEIFSAGDLIIAAGFAVFAYKRTLSEMRERRASSAAA